MNSIMKVLIALVAITALGGMAQAQDVFEITGSVTSTLEVTAPTTPLSVTLTPGTSAWQDAGDIGFDTNSENWAVKLTSDKVKMSNREGTSENLTSVMEANTANSDTSPTPITLGREIATLKSGTSGTSGTISLWLKQPILWTDKPHSDYSMNITITTEAT